MQERKKLLLQCIEKNPRAQRALYDQYKSIVMGLCRRYSRNKEEAEDIFQESFIRIFQHIDQLQDVDRMEVWIKRITVNASLNYYHKHKRHHHYQDFAGIGQENEDYEMILSGFSDEKIIELISQLADGYRIVFNLHVMEGYSHAEIAAMLSISEATSRSQLNRARQALQEKLRRLGMLKYERYA